MSIEKLWSKRRQERDVLGCLLYGVFKRKKNKKRSSPQEEVNSNNNNNTTCEEDNDYDLMMRRNKTKNLHMCLSEMMRKLKHAIRKEKKRKKSFQRSLSTTKDHFFMERMTSTSHKRCHQEEKHLSEMMLLSFAYQRRNVSLPDYSSPFSSPVRLWDHNSTVISRSSSGISITTIADDSIAAIKDEISTVDDGEKECQFLREISHEEEEEESLSPSHCISKTNEEYKVVIKPLFIDYEISPARGIQQPLFMKTQEKKHPIPMDEKQSVFNLVKAVLLDAIDTNWEEEEEEEELYLRTTISDKLINPSALMGNIPPLYPINQECDDDHRLLFDCINEVLFEFFRFPSFVTKPRTKPLAFSVILQEIQEEVYCNILPMKQTKSVDQIVRGEMANWLECDIDCVAFETSELVLNELVEDLILDLAIHNRGFAWT